ncbi:hypothetical protein X801_00762 [Opisthorchis viverrini]|uniref:Uncharacterized protein n=2 Tax=Opisthorchis viverrini TaxID=6198 RepID=A0A075AIX2_OPIVI|nr:hypothetical protein T265_01602 [Opisthorchis viverrini]KER32379.1 hypothetical protein T265_01602 [Opisthorchis viverrini]OON23329.1 hypothetical protein X801_00762 [Opisthorchis viverrini]
MTAARSTTESNTAAPQPTKTSLRYNLLAGGLAGCVAKSTIAPLDRAKITFQSTVRPFTVRELYRFLEESVVEQGFFSLWRGNTATLSRIFPYAAIQYSAHERYKHALGIDLPDMSHMRLSDLRLRRFLAGCMAGTTCVVTTYPLDFARARMAVTTSKRYHNVIHALRTVTTEEGARALYRGFIPAILGIIPYSGIAFFTFETLKEHRLNRHMAVLKTRPEKLRPFENLCCGAFSGVLGQTASYPLDIVRRRMQNAAVTGHPEYLNNIWHTMYIVYSTEGVFHGLYKGVTMNWIKGPIAAGISFTVFHQLQHFLHWYDRKSAHDNGDG